jgi:hypothetical protein
MTQYTDIYMRDDLADTGQVPNTERAFWTSPDIIPYGTSIYSGDWQQFFASNWSQDVGKAIVAGTTNYLYVRGYNKFNGAQTGTIQVYWANSSLLLQASQWVNNPVYTANNLATTAVAAAATNQTVVGADAFQWVPTQTSGGAHLCLLALVGTDENPAPVPSGNFASSTEYANWLLGHPAAVQRNVSVVNTPPPPSWQQSQLFINLDETAEEYLFQADISSLPVGTVVNFSCSASGPTPPINVSKTVPQGGPSPNWLSTVSQLPAEFSSSLVLTLQIPQGSAPPPQGITVDYGRVTQSRDTDELRSWAKPATELYPGADLAGLEVVILGSCVVRFAQG